MTTRAQLERFRRTPWGAADDVEFKTPGIHAIGTPSHGGFHVDPTLLAKMPACLREVGNGPWFEEDCEWSAVVLAFPDKFPSKTVEAARGCLQRWFPEAWAKFAILEAVKEIIQ